MEKIRIKKNNRIIIVIGVIFLLLLFSSLLAVTTAKYIKRQKDVIIARYTALYMDNTGDNKVVVLENNEGYMSFKLMNYIDEDVTKRDIVYSISKPSKFYNINGEEIALESYSNTEDFYVLDVWNTPQLIGKDTYKYDVSIEEDTGQKQDDDYVFVYESINDQDIGKTHDIVLKIKRTDGTTFSGEEHISIVVQLSKPYKEVHIFNITVTNRLIAFTTAQKQNFEIDYRVLYAQSINSYGYIYEESDIKERKSSDEKYTFLPKAIKLTLTWKNLLLDENGLNAIHIKKDENYSNIDITKPYIEKIENNENGELIIYVPQSSDFYLEFLECGNNPSLSAKIEVLVKEGNEEKYVTYDDSLGGYEHISDYYTIIGGNND